MSREDEKLGLLNDFIGNVPLYRWLDLNDLFESSALEDPAKFLDCLFSEVRRAPVQHLSAHWTRIDRPRVLAWESAKVSGARLTTEFRPFLSPYSPKC